MGGQFAGDADYLITFPRGTDIANSDQVDARNMTFDVVNVARPTYSFETVAACRTSS